MQQIRRIRSLLSPQQTKTLVHAFVLSRIDSNNALLYGLPQSSISRLQRVQNAAAKLICGARKFDSVTPLLKYLHWLPINERIVFKLNLLAFKCIVGTAPSYLSELLSIYTPSRHLRSSNDGRLLRMPRSKTKTFGDRAFSVTAPELWNSLPFTIRHSPTLLTFRSRLKTHLYNVVFHA